MVWFSWIIENEIPIRISAFIGVFALMALWETRLPARKLSISRNKRWLNNLSLVMLNTLVIRLIFPAAAVGVAIFAAQQGWGLLNIYQIPEVLAVVLAVIAMDFIIYLQHLLFHAIPLFWRLHKVHHADPDFDITTGTRFHTLEIILSMLIKMVTISILGAPVVAVILFEVLLNATAIFNHANIRLNPRLDGLLRLLVVTPDMHRVHHSVERDETNSNFGFNLPWWDRLFGTYRGQPRLGHEAMTIGLREYCDQNQVTRLSGMLMMPFIRPSSESQIKEHSLLKKPPQKLVHRRQGR